MGSRWGWAKQSRRVGSLALASVFVCSATAGAAQRWTIIPSVMPDGAGQSYLDSVSCTTGDAPATNPARSPATCFAVGSFITAKGAVRTLIERWNGKSWSISPSPVKPGNLASALVAVSCTKATSCIAVGNSRANAGARTVALIERWNGKSWKAMPSPTPSGSTGTYLNAVSCTSATNCYAVGNYTSGFSSGLMLIEHWNGAKWKLMPGPDPARAASTVLSGVSCTGEGVAATCWAVGSYATRPEGNPFYTVTARLLHGKWALVRSPNAHAGKPSGLNAVSCTSAKSCFAAGLWQHGYGATLVEHWNGAKWTVIRTPNPPGFTFSQLSGISCASARSCVAAGTYAIGSSGTSTLIEQWNGSRWTIDPSPAPAKAAGSALAGVSCVGATRCFTVGTYLTHKFGNPSAAFSAHRS